MEEARIDFGPDLYLSRPFFILFLQFLMNHSIALLSDAGPDLTFSITVITNLVDNSANTLRVLFKLLLFFFLNSAGCPKLHMAEPQIAER